MLRRTRLVLKGRSRAAMRCSLGYSIRTDEDTRRCLAAEGPTECWHLTLAKQARPDRPAERPRERASRT